MDTFSLLLDIVVTLGAALTLGLLLARLGQSPVVGYLLAGVLIGPHGLGLLRAVPEVRSMADLGVALLLFTIGLELPWRRLRDIGPLGAGAGVLQIVLTAAAALALARTLGASPATGAVIGLILAFSSTAVVFRVLADRAEIDSVPGRVSVGILLMQDLAVIPCLLVIPAIAGAGAGIDVYRELGGAVVRGALLVAALFLLARTLLPVLFNWAAEVRNRELFIILALVFCLGGTWAAHALGLSEVVGAFAAGVVLADNRFAAQMRAEIGPLRAGFLALFFVSIGMLADPGWIARNPLPLIGLVLAIVLGKALIAGLVVRLLRYPLQTALVSGWTLAHIGELSFVVADEGSRHQLIDADVFRLVVSGAVVTLLFAPYLISVGNRLASKLTWGAMPPAHDEKLEAPHADHVIVVGCGPTGQRVVKALQDVGTPYLVLELNPRTVKAAAAGGTFIEYGDASQEEILRHAGIMSARALVVTIPDPATAAAVIAAARGLRPDLLVVARARYAQFALQLMQSGAEVLLNEEKLMGEHLAAVSLKLLGLASEAVARVEPPGGTTPSKLEEPA